MLENFQCDTPIDRTQASFLKRLKPFESLVLVVSEKTLKDRPQTFEWLEKGLSKKSVSWITLELPLEERSLLNALEQLKDVPCEAIVALGGGAVLDGAKLLSFLYHYEEGRVKAILKSRALPQNHDIGPPVHVVPTSLKCESSVNRLVYVYDAYERLSYGLAHPHLLPASVLLDFDLIATLPKERGLFQAFDTLVTLTDGLFFREAERAIFETHFQATLHAIEAYYQGDFREGLEGLVQTALMLGQHQDTSKSTPLTIVQDSFMSLNPQLPIGVALRALWLPYCEVLAEHSQADVLVTLAPLFHLDVTGLTVHEQAHSVVTRLREWMKPYAMTRTELSMFQLSEEIISDTVSHIVLTHPEFTIFDEETLSYMMEKMFV
jgi:hypothetical protein